MRESRTASGASDPDARHARDLAARHEKAGHEKAEPEPARLAATLASADEGADEGADARLLTLDLRALFEAHVDHVGRSLRRLGVRDADVPDLVQEVFLVMHRILPDYDASRPVWPWIFGVVYRVAAAYRRTAFREILDDGTAAAARLDSSPAIDDALSRREDQALVLEALEGVEFHRRAAFVMADIDGVPVPEIARVLGIGVNTAYSRVRLAREDFRAAAARLLVRRGER
jgi:RNA polymerase sigma-70 factor (ECF subfamily)